FLLNAVESDHAYEDTIRTADCIHADLAAIFVLLELSRSTCLIAPLSPGSGEKMLKYSVPAGDTSGLGGKSRIRTGRLSGRHHFASETARSRGLNPAAARDRR